MSANTAPQIPTLSEGDIEDAAVSFVGTLFDGEALASVVDVAEQTTSDLTISQKSVSTSDLLINHRTVDAGEAVQFAIAGQLEEHSPYVLKLTVTTDMGRTKSKYVEFETEKL